MNKKVLVLSSSPRRGGNSDLLCDQFVRGAQEAGLQAEKVFLKDKTIHYCTGCAACFGAGKGCVQTDGMAEVLEKMIAADVIVMATPVYFYTMSAQMKTLIDRTCARYTEISGKDFYFHCDRCRQQQTGHGENPGRIPRLYLLPQRSEREGNHIRHRSLEHRGYQEQRRHAGGV